MIRSVAASMPAYALSSKLFAGDKIKAVSFPGGGLFLSPDAGVALAQIGEQFVR